MKANTVTLAALLATAVALAAPVRDAQAAAYTFSWTGSAGYSMSGGFSFDDALLGTGPITGAALADFSMTVLLNGVSQGSWALADGIAPGAQWNFNFDTTTDQFGVGGAAEGVLGQKWNVNPNIALCSTVGFASGASIQGVCVGGDLVAASIITTSPTNLTAARVTAAVPEPGTLINLGAALAALALVARRRVAG